MADCCQLILHCNHSDATFKLKAKLLVVGSLINYVWYLPVKFKLNEEVKLLSFSHESCMLSQKHPKDERSHVTGHPAQVVNHLHLGC